MTIPSEKSPEITNSLEKLTGRTTSIESNKCVNKPWGCEMPIQGFKDEISRKEYSISGLCQKCQDSVFDD